MSASPTATTPRDARILGESNLPKGGFMLLPNRLQLRGLLALEKLVGGREATFLVESSGDYDPATKQYLEADGVEAFAFDSASTDTEEFRKIAHQAVSKGRVLILVPAPTLSRVGSISEVSPEVFEFLLRAGVPTVPLFNERPAGSSLCIDTTKSACSVFSFGEVLEEERLIYPYFQEAMLGASEAAFSSREFFKIHLAYALLLGLKKHATKQKVVDGMDGSELPFGKLLAAAIVLSKLVRKATNEKRVAIVLPPGKAGILANLAVLFAGKVPVNLNFTASHEAIESSMKQAGIDRIITADPFVRKMPRFPWPANSEMILLDRVLPGLKKKIVQWFILSKLLPVGMLAKLIGIPKEGGDEEAVLLFTSGSSGDPKGVVLSHRNVLANVTQFGSRLELDGDDKLLACLPLFHSFGCTVTLWYPMIEGLGIVTYPSPLEIATLAELIEKYQVSLLLSTPTFLRGYLRKAKKKQLASLKLVVVGAEKLPINLATQFREKLGKEVMEGYGLTETSPVSNVNLPDLKTDGSKIAMPSKRMGSVGQMLNGIAVRVTDATTEKPLPISDSGMIWLKGANIFHSYLDLPEKTAEVKRDGWFCTGDIGRMDSDGFLYIEGRLSRFSKIGGEMVPHEKVESLLMKEMGMDSEAERKIMVCGIPDAAKGEALVILTTEDITDAMLNDVRYKLLEKGIPALWIPKKIRAVEEIPVLASGKLDLRACGALAVGS
ncbi:MAG: acyl-[acyl-carrier-protein]-phospholipid O-acyltransferase [Pseudoalteromonas tetraodonis]|jgi:acyl-[acyl-carrier-protein]-phospholipid O-acyltransferase/long-chain-fatty-acid--[acyl-carrier-protein] ligase